MEKNLMDEIVGKVLTTVKMTYEDVTFTFSDGSIYNLGHTQDCSESVWLEDVVGDFEDLIGRKITRFSLETDSYDTDFGEEEWNFYTMTSLKGTVVLRFCGQSNGYYSLAVTLEKRA